eukprot:1076385-Rhodomonas_salina.1
MGLDFSPVNGIVTDQGTVRPSAPPLPKSGCSSLRRDSATSTRQRDCFSLSQVLGSKFKSRLGGYAEGGKVRKDEQKRIKARFRWENGYDDAVVDSTMDPLAEGQSKNKAGGRDDGGIR